MLARIGETWVITRRDYQRSIEEALPSTPERETLRFVYVDLPARWRSWQRDLRGLRFYYLLWQIAAVREATRLRRSMRFDVVWHLTWANAWYGSLASLAGRPFVYGPVGGCVEPPWHLLPHLGWSGTAYEVIRAIARGAARYVNPLARLSWRTADLILAQNAETGNWFPRRHRSKVRLFPNAVIREEQIRPAAERPESARPTAVYAGRLEPFKGVFLCLHALVFLEGWELIVCGSGNDERRMRSLARRLGVEDRVNWVGWLPQEELRQRIGGADVLLFPSLHDEAPAVVAEALAVGLPIVCLDRGGAPLIAGSGAVCVAVDGSVRAVARRLAVAARTALEQRRVAHVNGDAARPLVLEQRAETLRDLLHRSLADSLDRAQSGT
jgi:glycosyltransferase involved in cell wall biosynthesis